MTASLLINGVDAETFGFTLAEAPGWSDMPARQVASAPVIGRQGVKDLADPQEQPRKLSLRGLVRGLSVADARTKLDALKLAMAAKPVQFTFADQPTRFVSGRLDSFTCQALTGSMAHGAMPVDATFVCSDPYFYDALLAGVLINYAPGDTISGELFSRSTTAYYHNQGGGNTPLSLAPINVKRDNHWLIGARSILLEDARTNPILWANDFSNAAWVKTNCTIATGIPDPASGSTACTITATGANSHCIQTLAPTTSLVRTNSIWIRRRTGVGQVFLRDAPNTGFTDVGTGLSVVWTRFQIAAGASAARNLDIQIATSGDAVDVWCAQMEDGSFASSEIPTTNVPVTRAADSYFFPSPPPQESSVYTKFVELGTAQIAGLRVFELANAADTIPRFLSQAQPTTYGTYHNNGSGFVTSVLSAGPAQSDIVEHNARLFDDGSTDLTQSLNSAAPTSSARSAANTLAGAWSANLCWLNSGGTVAGTTGFIAIQSFKIVLRARTLDEMRAIPKMPLGTAPARPLVRITGAAVNPVITLYNKAGVAVASITLTITTIAGDILEIDMDAKTVKKNGVNSISSITAGDFFSIDPADQTNFGAPGPSINSSSGALTVEYRKAWR